jgi:fucose permease
MIRNRSIIIWPTFLSLSLLGALLSSIGASLPAIQEYFGTSIEQTGRVSALFQLGYALLCFFGGVLTDFFGKNRVLTAGGILYGASTLLLGAASSFPANLLLFTAAGVGGGLLFIASNTLVVQLFPERRGTYLNLHHLFFAIASVLAPLLTRALLAGGHRWDSVYHLLGGGALLIAAFFLFTRAGAPTSALDRSALQGLISRYRRILRDRGFLSLLAANTLAIGTQFATIYLLVLFMTRARGVSYSAASLLLSVYFILLAAGRLLCSALITRQPITRIVTALLGLLAASLLVGWLTRGPVSAVSFALTGLASSGLMPSLLALASHMLPAEVTGSAMGLLAMFGGLGGMALTWLTTWIAGAVGLHLAFLAVILVSFLALGYFIALRVRFRSAERQET